MKKKIYIIITIISLLFGGGLILHRNITNKVEKACIKPESNIEHLVFATQNTPTAFKTLYEYVKEIITFITSIMGFILTIREIRRKKT